MKIVGIRELKDRLSEYIRHVRRKGPILISSRGEVVAELRSSYGTRSRADLHPGLRELAEQGRLRIGAPPDASVYEALPRLLPEGAALDLLDAERGER